MAIDERFRSRCMGLAAWGLGGLALLTAQESPSSSESPQSRYTEPVEHPTSSVIMMKIAAIAALATVSSAMPASTAKGAGRWCAGAPLGDESLSFTAATLAAARAERSVGDHVQFRGAFRDLSLWIEAAGTHDVKHCEVFDAHSGACGSLPFLPRRSPPAPTALPRGTDRQHCYCRSRQRRPLDRRVRH